MKFKYYLLTGLCTASLFSLSSCFDSDYDLTDIDTTSRIELQNLTIPINVDKVKLQQILDISEESQVKQIVDPATKEKIYAVLEEGSFESNAIKIPSFTTSVPNISPIVDQLPLEIINDLNGKVEESINLYIDALLANNYSLEEARKIAEERREEEKKNIWNNLGEKEPLAQYVIKDVETSFETSTSNADKSIRSIENIGVNATLGVKLRISNLKEVIDQVKIENLKIKLPKGLKISVSEKNTKYDEKTGILDLSDADIVIKNGEYDNLKITIENISNTDELTFIPHDDAPGELTFKSTVKSSGSVVISKSNFKDGKTFFDLPIEGSYSCEPAMSSIAVNTFTGNIKYDVEKINIDPISLNGIPEVFAGEETNIFLNNPQIYLTLSNPLSEDNVYAETKISLTSEKNGVKRDTKTMNNMLQASGKDNIFCISPYNPESKYPGFENAKWEEFKSLGEIVSGAGIPDKINVEVIDPKVPEQKVVNFNLGKEIDKVKGDYLFYAPLSLNKNTLIVYRTEMDGWNDETLDKLVINNLSFTANVDSELPLDAEVTIKPIKADGTEIPGVSFNTVSLSANSKNKELVLTQQSGTISNLDGIKIVAFIKSQDEKKIISPVQTIKMNNIKVNVSGYYEDEL